MKLYFDKYQFEDDFKPFFIKEFYKDMGFENSILGIGLAIVIITIMIFLHIILFPIIILNSIKVKRDE